MLYLEFKWYFTLKKQSCGDKGSWCESYSGCDVANVRGRSSCHWQMVAVQTGQDEPQHSAPIRQTASHRSPGEVDPERESVDKLLFLH